MEVCNLWLIHVDIQALYPKCSYTFTKEYTLHVLKMRLFFTNNRQFSFNGSIDSNSYFANLIYYFEVYV